MQKEFVARGPSLPAGWIQVCSQFAEPFGATQVSGHTGLPFFM